MMITYVPAFKVFNDVRKRFKFAYGGRGSGKSINIGNLLLNKGRENRIRILCAREVQKSIKDSVHSLLSDSITQYKLNDYTVLANEIRNSITGTDFIFAGLKDHTIDSIKSYQGIDYCWVEEAQSVSKKSLDILTPTIRKENSEIWFSYNRKNELDPVHILFQRECTKQENRKWSYKEKLYKWTEFEGNDALGLFINYDGNQLFPEVLRREMEKDKETDYNLYMHKWLGEPEFEGYYSLINRKDVLEAINRPTDNWQFVTFGVDPARYGDDKSVICIRNGLKILPLISFNGIDTMRLTGEIIQKAKEIYTWYKDMIDIRVDDTGIGAGVVDRLSELARDEKCKDEKQIEFNINVIPIMFNGTVTDTKYKDFGTQMWGNISDSLKTISIPDDKELISQLTSRKYKIESDGKIKLESKDEMKKKGFHSPDYADALALCLAPIQSFSFNDTFSVKKNT